MASIIKNQIIKHLSAFARNLKPEQISVEVLRGKGQLRDLELNEEVLAERLELPPWLKIVKAHCSSVSVKIPWTRLKGAPVQLFVEEIRVTIRLVASAIPNKKKMGVAIAKSYDLAERVIEGISLHVQSIEVYFETESQSNVNFGGSIMFSQFVLESRTPNWQSEQNINMTRIHDKSIRQVLFFKHIHWRVLKIEASANLKSDENFGMESQRRSSLNSPLRFLTENGRVRITIKKNTLDCSLIAGRIELILEEIHWLAYMAHLRSAIDFYKHILDLANSVGKDLPISLVKQPQGFTHPGSAKPNSNAAQNAHQLVPSIVFQQFDIPQSSHHLIISRIDLHLCDDSSSDDLPSDWNIESGAMQAIVQKLRIDFYPQHAVFERLGEFSTRKSWLRYSSPNPFTDLVKMQLDQHFRVLTSRMEPNLCDRFVRSWPQLVSQNVIIRIENLIIQSVSERTTKKDALKCMLSMNRRAKEKLPQTISFFHLEVSSYNFPATNAYPLPPDAIHLVLAPLELAPDSKSVRWLVYALENILNSFDTPQISSASKTAANQRPDIRFEFIMPKIVLLPNEDLPFSSNCSNSPSQANIINTSSSTQIDDSPESTQKCAAAIDDFRFPRRFILNASTAYLSNFVLLNDRQVPLPAMFKNARHAAQREFIKMAEQCLENVGILKEFELRTKALDGIDSLLERIDGTSMEWFISIPSLWVNSDFGPDSWELPMLSDLSIFGCIVSRENASEGNSAGNSILLEPRTNVGVAVDHFQFVKFLELIDRVNILMDQIGSDRAFFRKHLQNLQKDLPVSIYCQCEKVHLRLILPPGPAPSPYDLKWTAKLGGNENNVDNIISPSNTSNSYSDLPIDEMANAQIAKSKGSSAALFPYEPAAIAPNSNLTAETVGGIAIQGGLKTVDSIGGISDITVSGKLPLEMLVSKKLLVGTANLPDFIGIAPTPSDLESNLDETLSITTSASAEHICFDATLTGDDVFDEAAEDIVEAEEALENSEQDQDIRILRRKEKLLGREMNVFDVMLQDLNIHARAHDGRTKALGFARSIYVDERLRVNCGAVYAEKGATMQVPISLDKLQIQMEDDDKLGGGKTNPMQDAKLKFTVNSAPRQSLIKLDINGINICLSDEVVSQLAPFIQNPAEDENPAALHLSLEECKIEIKDPKKRFPLRIKLGALSIEDGPGCEKRCQ